MDDRHLLALAMASDFCHMEIVSKTVGERLWLSGKVVKNEKINKIERTRVRSPPRATSFKKIVSKRTMGMGTSEVSLTVSKCFSRVGSIIPGHA
jgi:hypothetical protein